MNKLKFIFFLFFLINFYNQQFAQSKSFQDGVIYLSDYIASQEFESKDNLDISLVDTLFVKAKYFYNGNISEALLALTFATLPFNKMPLTIPFIKLRFDLKLPSVDDKTFLQKRKNIPGIVYFDSNHTGGQDKDKVAHFFGNAFLKYNVSIINLSKFLGFIVESFESTFKVSGGTDQRDLITNYLGEFFGYSLKKNKDLLPSDFFKLYSLFYFSYN